MNAFGTDDEVTLNTGNNSVIIMNATVPQYVCRFVWVFFAFAAFSINAHMAAAADKKAGPFFDRAPYVNPMVVRELVTWISDSDDLVVAIDLDHAHDSNQFFDQTDRMSGEFSETAAEVKLVSGRDIYTDVFAYRYVGKTDSGVIVLHTSRGSTGSGIWMNLLFLVIEYDYGLKFDKEAGTATMTRPRRLLRKLGDIFLGDRWYGQLKVEGNKVFIGRDHGRYTEDWAKSEPYGEESWRTDPNDWETVLDVEYPGPLRVSEGAP